MSTAQVEKNQDVVRCWIDDVFNAKKIERIEQLKVGSYLDWTPLPHQKMDQPISGMKQTIPTFMRSLPDFEFLADELFGEGDLVACIGHWSATHNGDAFLGIPASHKKVGGSRIDLFRVVGDKMVEHWGCGNELRFLEMMSVLPGGASDHAAPPDGDPKQVGRRFVEEVLVKRNLRAMNALVNTQAVDHNNGSITMYFVMTAFPDYCADVKEVFCEKDLVTVISNYRATHRGEFMGFAATGNLVSGRRVDVFRIVNGEIMESWQDWDRAGLVQQIRLGGPPEEQLSNRKDGSHVYL